MSSKKAFVLPIGLILSLLILMAVATIIAIFISDKTEILTKFIPNVINAVKEAIFK